MVQIIGSIKFHYIKAIYHVITHPNEFSKGFKTNKALTHAHTYIKNCLDSEKAFIKRKKYIYISTMEDKTTETLKGKTI